MEVDYPSEAFVGVQFVLFGFNHLDEKQIRAKLINGGGVDVGQYGPSCSHVIVNKDKIVYDDPVCVAARNDGKLLVTGLWVDHRYDSGLLADATSVLYRPLRELNGIPGAKSLIMCLTGYQRQDRDDVMTMVGLMGAQFSKPLVANKVTHLICYKFEGDKYELAKRLRTIKLVNHRWLEDSLREWMLLPESNYNMSGYDMEMFEAEAKDSEEESNNAITKHSVRKNAQSPNAMKFGLYSTSEISNILPASKTLHDCTNIVDPKSMSTVPTIDRKFSPGKFDKQDSVGGLSCKEADVFSTARCSVPSDMHIKTTEYEKQKMKSEAVTTPSNAARSPQLCATSYSRSRKTPLKSPLPLFSGERLDRAAADVSYKMAAGEIKDNIGIGVAKTEQLKDGTFSGNEQISKGADLFGTGDSNARMPLKGISDVSYDAPQSHQMSKDTKSCTVNNPSIDEMFLGLEMKSVSLNNDGSRERRAMNLQHNMAITDTSSSIKKPLTCDLPFSNSVLFPTEDVAEDSKKTPRTPIQISGKDKSPKNADKLNHDYRISGDVVGKTEETYRLQSDALVTSESDKSKKAKESASPTNLNFSAVQNNDYRISGDVVGKTEETDRLQSDALVTSESDKSKKAKKSASPTNVNFSAVQNNNLNTKQQRIKMLAKKSLGSRPKLGSASRKGSILSNKATSLNDSISSTNGNNEKFFGSSQDDSIEVKKVVETTDNGDIFKKYEAMDEDDKTTDPENEKAGYEQQIMNEDNFKEAPLTSDVDMLAKETASGVKCNNSTSVLDDTIHVNDVDMLAKETASGVKCNNSTSVLDDTIHVNDVDMLAKETASGVKCNNSTSVLDDTIPVNDVDMLAKETASGVKCNNSSSVLDDTIPSGTIKEVVEPREPISIGRNVQLNELRVEDEKSKLDVRDRGTTEKTKLVNSCKMKSKQGKVSKAPRKKAEKMGKKPQLVAAEVNAEVHTAPDYKSEKENEPCNVGDKTSDHFEHCLEKPTVKSNAKQRNANKKSSNSSMEVEVVLREVKPEPVCFILSGHRLERKEFQKIIKHLKGRVCRDSHQWSYQATHFITPDPVRRTEKFFSAAASGRWILKSDYLTDSSQAGKLLKEEPYEWNKTSLTEDGAINLEAPRKWRLLREKTGHGAFYGMRIIIYGECIAPPLDTLKRAVKAGDGDILATSPPYTKFLKSGVDFAVVSPGITRVDAWVQEFINNEIPCVAADYLVEYVCKPGYPLDKHVLYNTHPWAEKSFSNLQSRAEEVAKDSSPQDGCSDNDVACQKCESRNREETMLICGNEDGSIGCGIGMHIDCCNPPLLDIPEGDWFCPDCIRSRNSNNSPNKRKKGVSVKRK